jgi:nicotinamide phosphoribosyltransferase
MTSNLVLKTDSYKVSQWSSYHPGVEYVYSYLESRGGLFTETVMFGLQYYLKKYLSVPVTKEMVEYARLRYAKHFGDDTIFNYDGWMRVVNEFSGYLPLEIRAVPEGTVVPTRNVLMAIRNIDAAPGFAWCVQHIETLLLKVWYPITVATLSRQIKKIIHQGLVTSGTPEEINFKLHDFGYRGVSSEESAGIGGGAHLVNFLGTDTIEALEFCQEFYGEEMAGFSIPATEHFNMMHLGETGEVELMKRFLQVNMDKTVPAIACVSDTFNIFRACKDLWGGSLKTLVHQLSATGKILVVRPDSGEPVTIVRQVIETLNEAFGHTVNEKGYKVLNHVRVIQGDGVDLLTIQRIVDELLVRGWSLDNVAFGMGGALLQGVNRDTLKFAFKASEVTINGQRRDIRKDPITDSGKRSKLGRLKLVNANGVLETVRRSEIGFDIMEEVWNTGTLFADYSMTEIRSRAAL